eukprot:TRINITY_DN3255_c0_g2_i1.p1 TRINITY_DN3255_c0_g2~~TRINITY_DN3255_c0_g2_i1.p1  ORF type:complete len:572 (-),score=99.79 TRINITY_DN3255_c0_g2_i1:158-1873(-)
MREMFYQGVSCKPSYHIILFDCPTSYLHYLSQSPIDLSERSPSITTTATSPSSAATSPTTTSTTLPLSPLSSLQQLNLSLPSLLDSSDSPTRPTHDIKSLLYYLNAAAAVDQRVRHKCGKHLLNKKGVVHPSQNNINNTARASNKLPMASFLDSIIDSVVFKFLSIVYYLASCVLSMPLPFVNYFYSSTGNSSKHGEDAFTPKDLLFSFDRVYHKANRVLSWSKVKHSLESDELTKKQKRVKFIKLYNSVLIVLIDTVLGMALSLLVVYNGDACYQYLLRLEEQLNTELLKSWIEWLMGWPGGLKLNAELDFFIGRVCLFLLLKWQTLLLALLKLTLFKEMLIFALAICSGIFGISMAFSFLRDLLVIATMHVRLFHFIAQQIYLIQLHAFSSFWKLFRGKKHNVLKQRIDSCDYEIDQLLLGTLLFTLLFFLFPTTAAYYYFFAFVRALVKLVEIELLLTVDIMQHIPVYVLLIHRLDPRLLPGGVSFEIKKHVLLMPSKSISSSNSIPPSSSFDSTVFLLTKGTTVVRTATYLVLKGHPIHVREITRELLIIVVERFRNHFPKLRPPSI